MTSPDGVDDEEPVDHNGDSEPAAEWDSLIEEVHGVLGLVVRSQNRVFGSLLDVAGVGVEAGAPFDGAADGVGLFEGDFFAADEGVEGVSEFVGGGFGDVARGVVHAADVDEFFALVRRGKSAGF